MVGESLEKSKSARAGKTGVVLMSSIYRALNEFKAFRSREDRVVVASHEKGRFRVAKWLHGSGPVLLAEHRASPSFEQYLIYPSFSTMCRVQGLIDYLRSRGWGIPRIKLYDCTFRVIAKAGGKTYLADTVVFTRDPVSGVTGICGVEVGIDSHQRLGVFQRFSDMADMLLDAREVIDVLREVSERGVDRILGKPTSYHIDKLSRLVAHCEEKYGEIGARYGLAYGFVYAGKLREADAEASRLFRRVEDVYMYALRLYSELQPQLQGGRVQGEARAVVPVAQEKA
jgi:hypothetical protein